MWRATSALLIAILGVCSLGSRQPPPDPVDVLRRTTEALERLHVVRYDARYTRGTVLSDEIVAVKGSVAFFRGTGTESARVKVHAELYTSFRPDRTRIEATFDGTRWLFVDPKAKSFARGPDRAAGGQGGRNSEGWYRRNKRNTIRMVPQKTVHGCLVHHRNAALIALGIILVILLTPKG